MGDISRHSNDFNLKQELNPNKVSSQKLGVKKKDRPDKLRPEAPSLPDNPGSQAMLPQDIEKIPNSDSAKAGNPEGTPTGKSEGTPACNPEDAPTPILGSPEWARQQWVRLINRPGVKNLTDRHGIELPSETNIKDIEGNVTGELEEMDSQRRAKALGLGLPPKFTKELRNQDIEATQKPEVKQDIEATQKPEVKQDIKADAKDDIILQKARERTHEGKYRLPERNLSLGGPQKAHNLTTW